MRDVDAEIVEIALVEHLRLDSTRKSRAHVAVSFLGICHKEYMRDVQSLLESFLKSCKR